MTSYTRVFTSLHNSKATSVFEDQRLANSHFLAGSLLTSFSLFGHLLWLNKENKFSVYIYLKYSLVIRVFINHFAYQ